MFQSDELQVIRGAYARQVAFLAGADNAALEAAFAQAPRERYLGPGPNPINEVGTVGVTHQL